jgi:lipid-A-disaccharide synthase-like uncharacterized protein
MTGRKFLLLLLIAGLLAAAVRFHIPVATSRARLHGAQIVQTDLPRALLAPPSPPGGAVPDRAGLDRIWLAVGLAGQLLFSARFLVQWVASERRQASTVPTAFWYLSVAGGLVLLAYAVYKADMVFIVGQAGGLLIYGRNLWFLARRRRPADAAGDAPALAIRQT